MKGQLRCNVRWPNLQCRVYDVPRHGGCNWVQPDTSTLCARGGYEMPCMMAPLCGECISPISGQCSPLQLSRWPSYEAPRPAVKLYAVATLCDPRYLGRLFTANNGIAGRRGTVISWHHSSSIVRIAAVSQATQAGTSSHVRQLHNECTRPTECGHQSIAVISHRRRGWALSCAAFSTSCYTGSWLLAWKWTALFLASLVSPSPRCFRPKMAWCLRLFNFFC